MALSDFQEAILVKMIIERETRSKARNIKKRYRQGRITMKKRDSLMIALEAEFKARLNHLAESFKAQSEDA